MKSSYVYLDMGGIAFIDQIIEENGVYRFGITYEKTNNDWIKRDFTLLSHKRAKSVQELVGLLYTDPELYNCQIISEKEAFLMLL